MKRASGQSLREFTEASKTIHHRNWFEVVRESGRIADRKVAEFQVMLKIGFKIER